MDLEEKYLQLIYQQRIVVNAHGSRMDKNGCPMFLIFLDGQWIWRSAKHFKPFVKVLNDQDKGCRNCRNNADYPPPHTCDYCTSLDAEENEMWEPII